MSNQTYTDPSNNMHQYFSNIRLVFLVATLALLSACSTKKITSDETSSTSDSISASSPEKLLSLAYTTPNANIRNASLLRAAAIYWEQGFSAQSKAVISEIDTRYIAGPDWNDYWLLSLDIALIEQDVEALKKALPNLQSSATFQRSVDEQREIINKLTQAYELVSQPIQAALLLITQRAIYAENTLINEQIWRLLKAANTQSLARYQDDTGDYDVQGWLALAKTIRLKQSRLQEQYQALVNWQAIWEFHPAVNELPKELEILSQLPKNRPKNIIIALPFSGPLAPVSNAIKDGLLAKYYEYKENQDDQDSAQYTENQPDSHAKKGEAPSTEITISTYDTNSSNFTDLYNRNLPENSIIIGPLKKETLAELLNRQEVPVKTLALNYVSEEKTVKNLYQFSLNPEHETAQIAERMALDKLHRIGMLAPENDWGLRAFDAFTIASQKHHGTVVEGAFYGAQNTLSAAVAKMLATDQSKQRARTIRQITGLRLESTPRRRQDIDAVFMVAKAGIAKQLKPLLSYHYANDLPVYATSQVHDLEDSSRTRDLNGIMFVDMPWSLSTSGALRHQLESHFPQNAARYSRFYAMGIDAFQIAPRIELLTQVENSLIEGQTGELSITLNNTIQRHLQWARFKGGKPSVIN